MHLIDDYRRAIRRLKNLEQNHPRAAESPILERLRRELEEMASKMTADQRRLAESA